MAPRLPAAAEAAGQLGRVLRALGPRAEHLPWGCHLVWQVEGNPVRPLCLNISCGYHLWAKFSAQSIHRGAKFEAPSMGVPEARTPSLSGGMLGVGARVPATLMVAGLETRVPPNPPPPTALLQGGM